MVQWLRLRASIAGDVGSIPGRGTKIPHATRRRQKRKEKKKGLPQMHSTELQSHKKSFPDSVRLGNCLSGLSQRVTAHSSMFSSICKSRVNSPHHLGLVFSFCFLRIRRERLSHKWWLLLLLGRQRIDATRVPCGPSR